MTKTLPRGVRNNNPGNIEWNGDPWQGLVPVEQRTDSRFCQFVTPAYGIRALARTLITYYDRHRISTIEDAIARWAPPVENDTLAYQNAVARAVGVSPNQIIDLHDYGVLRPMVEAIIRHENGVGPLRTANTWYPADTIDEGLRLAGVRPSSTQAAKVPVTKETVGATATGAVGVAEIADALPSVMTAIRGAEGHLSSGSVSRILIGVALVALAAFIAYGQVKKHQQGAL